jgi:hypothetical protein
VRLAGASTGGRRNQCAALPKCARCCARRRTTRADPTHPLNPHFARVAVRRGYKTAVVGVAHRLCRILFALLRDGSDFDPARLGVEVGHFTRATTYKYRFTPKPAGRLPAAG